MKNLFNRIKAWHCENKQYNGFFQMECFGCITALLLVMNIIRLSNDPVDWMFLMIEMVITSFYIERWFGNKRFKEFSKLTKEIHDLDYNFAKSIIDQLGKEHDRLVAANRRRKLAERKLKKVRLALRKESADRLGFEIECNKYEQAILMPNGQIRDDLLHVYYLQIKEREENKKKENQEQ